MKIFKIESVKKTLVLAKDLKKIREKKGISQRKLAKAAGISPAFLSDIEAHRRGVSENTAKAIEGALDANL